MNKAKQRAVVICPGRGTYNKPELGYLSRWHPDEQDLIRVIDRQRQQQGQATVSSLDQAASYNLKQHTAGENASSLIYACAKADFNKIDQDEYDIVAVTGNSMGWYIALAVANAINHGNASHLINTMGSMMVDGVVGGQSIYPIVDENWHLDPGKQALVAKALVNINQQDGCELYASIHLGGYQVFGGNDAGLNALQNYLPNIDNQYPMRLFNHAAFHTPMLQHISRQAKSQLAKTLFQTPYLPMVDGQGRIWQPYSCNTDALYDYTLGTQVTDCYDFTKAIEVSIKEFAPDKLIILGPGATLGGAVAQTLIKHNWFGLGNKTDFISRQKQDPVVLAMGMPEQRGIVTGRGNEVIEKQPELV